MKVHIGERMTMRFNVVNKEGKDFTISGGDYTVKVGDSIQTAGELMIDGHQLRMIFQPDKVGIHRIQIWYDVETDRRQSEFLVEVVA